MKTTETKSNRGGARKGAGRPKLNEPRMTISMVLDVQTAEHFKALAKEMGLSQPKTFKLMLNQTKDTLARY
jgi:hypothetical protein